MTPPAARGRIERMQTTETKIVTQQAGTGLAQEPKPVGLQNPLHIWAHLASAADAEAWVESHLAAFREKIAALLAVTGTRTVANTLALYDDACWHLGTAGRQAGVMFMVHPLAAVRDAVQALQQNISAEGTALSLNREVYEALVAIDASTEDDATKYYLERVLLGYRLSGVDKDEATREKIRALADRMTELSMRFSRTVQDDVRKVEVTDLSELAGLPPDYLARHGVRVSEDGTLSAEGAVVLTTDSPSMVPVMTYAASARLRREMYLAYNNRAYPANQQVLLELLQAREEMAALLGFRSWADLATVDQMMGSAAKMRSFLEEVEAAARETAKKEFAELEAFVRERDPQALPLSLSDARYWEEQYRRAHFDFDSQSVRPYFPYEQVEAGILATAARLFRVRFERNHAAAIWAPGVKAFEVYDEAEGSDGKQRIGRIYLDMHPREGKSKWFSECSLVSGKRGQQLPEASLVCNFPQPKINSESPENDDPGLLQYSDVVTCFHEFGHLIHEVLGGRQRWAGQSGIATEGDFVEVPSQMLEEFFEDADLVREFARHVETGEPLPYEVFTKMLKASAHGRALSTLTQVMYASYSLNTHDLPASSLDLDALLRAGYDRFSHYEFVEGNRMYAAFTHLVGYTSNYYTYLYDKVMALEFFAHFDGSSAKALLDGPAAMRYRRMVLEPGGSKPARALVAAFLGIESEGEVSTDALKRWIQQGLTA
jgi:thimet oligopeptidase